MDIKHVLSTNRAMWPAYHELPTALAASSDNGRPAADWTSFDGGEVWVGHDGDGFAFDNESPRHRTFLPSYRLANRLVTCRQWLEFMADGGYDTPTLWLSDGWHQRQEHRWDAPSYWDFHTDDGWRVFTLHGLQPLSLDEPVCHLSYYEADAFARWAGPGFPPRLSGSTPPLSRGRRATWVTRADGIPLPPRPAMDSASFTGTCGSGRRAPTASYPGFRPAPGAVGEYNGKFMVNQFVLRGGACVTPPGHIRATYRNFFHPHTRWHFSGVRLAQ